MSMTTAEALRLFSELDLPPSSAGMKPLDPDTVESLRQVEGYANPGHMAGNLSSALRTLWVAIQSGEQNPDDTANAVWLLSEVAALIDAAAEAHEEAGHWLTLHEKAEAAQTRKATSRKPGKSAKAARGVSHD